jgi:hypothetical protein
MQDNGLEAFDFSEDEFAKSHVRHLVGGRAEVKDERVFRFGQFASHKAFEQELIRIRVPRKTDGTGELLEGFKKRFVNHHVPLSKSWSR